MIKILITKNPHLSVRTIWHAVVEEVRNIYATEASINTEVKMIN